MGHIASARTHLGTELVRYLAQVQLSQFVDIANDTVLYNFIQGSLIREAEKFIDGYCNHSFSIQSYDTIRLTRVTPTKRRKDLNRLKICVVTAIDSGARVLAYYTLKLAENWRSNYQVNFIGFKKLASSNLYPDQGFLIQKRAFDITTHSLFSWIKAFFIINKISPDIVLFHWWNAYLNPSYIFLMALLRKRKKVIILHNVESHEKNPFDMLNSLIYILPDGIIVHTIKGKETLISRFPIIKGKIVVIPYGNADYYDNSKYSELQAKEILNVQKPTLLFFGYVRKYKGLKYLLHAIRDINCTLLIVGKFVESYKHYQRLIKDLDIENKIKIVPRFILDVDIELYFKAADIVVMPYTHFSSQSAVAQTAMTFSKPIIATRVDGLKEFLKHKETAYLIEPRSVSDLREAIVELIENKGLLKKMRENLELLDDKYDWKFVAEKYTRYFETSLKN